MMYRAYAKVNQTELIGVFLFLIICTYINGSDYINQNHRIEQQLRKAIFEEVKEVGNIVLQDLDSDSAIALATVDTFFNKIISNDEKRLIWVLGKKRRTMIKKEGMLSHYSPKLDRLEILPTSFVIHPDNKNKVAYLLYERDARNNQFIWVGTGNLCTKEKNITVVRSPEMRQYKDIALYSSIQDGTYGYRSPEGDFFLFAGMYNMDSRIRLLRLKWCDQTNEPKINFCGKINLMGLYNNTYDIKKIESDFYNKNIILTFINDHSIVIDPKICTIKQQRRPLQQWVEQAAATPTNRMIINAKSSFDNNQNLALYAPVSSRGRRDYDGFSPFLALKLCYGYGSEPIYSNIEVNEEKRAFKPILPENSNSSETISFDSNLDLFKSKKASITSVLSTQENQIITHVISWVNSKKSPKESRVIIDMDNKTITTDESCLSRQKATHHTIKCISYTKQPELGTRLLNFGYSLGSVFQLYE